MFAKGGWLFLEKAAKLVIFLTVRQVFMPLDKAKNFLDYVITKRNYHFEIIKNSFETTKKEFSNRLAILEEKVVLSVWVRKEF